MNNLKLRIRLFLYFIFICLAILIFFNFWILFDCKYCLGHECRNSICEGYHKNINCPQNNNKENNIHRFNTSDGLEWQLIRGTNIYVYSAFRRGDYVHIVGKANFHYADQYLRKLVCVFHDLSFNQLEKSFVIIENDQKKYDSLVSVRIRCASKIKNSSHLKIKLLENDSYFSQSIKINPMSDERKIVVCIRPLFGSFSSTNRLIEFISYYKINRIDKIIFYLDSVSPKVLNLLKSFEDIVEVLPWNSFDGMSHNEDQLSSIDDCIFRNPQSIIIVVDIDEYIVPKIYSNLKQMIEFYKKDKSIIGLSFNNVFFCDEFNENKFPKVIQNTKRQSTIWSKGFRSKLILLNVSPIKRMGIHGIMSYDDFNYKIEFIDPKNAVLFHYRTCCDVGRTPILAGLLSLRTLDDSIQSDFSILKYKDEIINYLKVKNITLN